MPQCPSSGKINIFKGDLWKQDGKFQSSLNNSSLKDYQVNEYCFPDFNLKILKIIRKKFNDGINSMMAFVYPGNRYIFLRKMYGSNLQAS